MKKMTCILFLFVCAAVLFPVSASGQENVFPALTAYKWQNRETVDFDNLKYTGTHVVLVFWDVIDLEADVEVLGDPLNPGDPNSLAVPQDSNETTDRGAVNWLVKAVEKFQDANIAVIGVIEKGNYSWGRSQNRKLDTIPHLRDRSHTIREKVCKQGKTCSFVVIAPDGKVISGVNNVRFASDKNYFASFNGDIMKSTTFKRVYDGGRFSQIADNLRYGHIGAAYKMVKSYIGKDGTAKNDKAAKAWAVIQQFMTSLKEDVESAAGNSAPAEAYRIAAVGLTALKGVRDDLVTYLKGVLKDTKREKAVKKLEYQQKLFLSAAGLCEKGMAEKAGPLLKQVVSTDADSFYGKAAAVLLQTL